MIPTEQKVELIDALARTGLRRLEVTSFVRAEVIPQLADAGEVLDAIDVPDEVAVGVLVPNERGLDARARAPLEDRRDQRLPVGLRDAQPEERQPLDRGVARRASSACSAARARRACAARGSSRPRSAAPTRATCPPSACSRSRRACATRAPRRSASATPPAWPTRCRCGEFFGEAPGVARRRGRADGALPQHARPGARERARGARGRRRQLRVELRRARRLPGAAGRDRQHRQRGPRLDAARDGHRDGHRPAGAARLRARASRRSSAARSAATRSWPVRWTGALSRPAPPAPRPPSRALSRAAATQYSCTATSISSVCASAGRAEASITRLARPTATGEFASSSSHQLLRSPARAPRARRRG